MKISRRIAAISLAASLLSGAIVGATSAAAAADATQEPQCSTANAATLFAAHGVDIDASKSLGAYLDTASRPTSCVVWVADLAAGESSTRLTLSKNTKVLWSTRTEKTVQGTYSSVETFTKAGRKALGVKTIRYSYKTTQRKNGDKKVTTYRNAGGSQGRRVAVATTSRGQWSNKVTIRLTPKQGRVTKIVVREKCRVNTATPRCAGSQTSNAKKYRGAFNVILAEKASSDLLVSHGLARSGQGASRYNKVYRLEQSNFGAERNGYARSRG